MLGVKMAEINYLTLIENLKINEAEITEDLSEYYDHVKGRYMQKSKIEQAWGSVENYVNALYWMKFVMKLSHYEMDEITNVRNFYKAYKDLGWYYNSFDFQECKKMHQAELTRLQNIYDAYDSNSEIFNQPEYLNIRKSIVLKQTSITRMVNNYKVTDIEELIKIMYFFVHVEKLCTSEIATIFGKDRLTVAKVIKNFNMNISRQEARKRVEINGRGNHRQSAVAGRQTMLQRAIKNGVTSNNSENICRATIETRLYMYLNVTEYEFIVGLSSNAIIPPKEIDIPIMIYEKCSDKYYRYAIELDGNVWHKDKGNKDEEKNVSIENTCWKLIRIEFKDALKNKKKIAEGFRKMADDVCMIILSDIKGEDNKWNIKYIESF